MLGEKLRFRFEKTGPFRLLSHHDLMRCFERMLRRTALPFKSTGGFHPTPRIVFALSLSLGIEGMNECVEIEFLHEIDANEAFEKLAAQCPAGLRFTCFTVVPMKATAVPRRAVFTLDLPPDRVEAARVACAELMARPQVWVDRYKPSPKQLNIRPYLRSVVVNDSTLTLDLWVTQTGTARADELLRLLNLADAPDLGGVLRRELLELRDEVTGSDSADVPPDGPAETLPLGPGAAVAALRDREPPNLAAHWGATLAGPAVE